MASIPLASTSKVIFTPSASSRVLKSQLLRSTRIVRPLHAASRVGSRDTRTYATRTDTTARQAATSTAGTSPGASNTGVPSTAGPSSSSQDLASATLAKSARTKQTSVTWAEEQLERYERQENRKWDAPMKGDDDRPFVFYIPPPVTDFRPFSEKWVTFWYGRFQNFVQSFRAGRDTFTTAKYAQNKKTTVKDTLLPLYKAVCNAKATGQVSRDLVSKLSLTLKKEIRRNVRKQHELGGAQASWHWHALDSARIVTIRQVEFKKDQPTLQVAVRIVSKQSLEISDRSGKLLPFSGNHEKPVKVVENFVFQKKLNTGTEQQWSAVDHLPTLTQLQAIGNTDKRLLEAGNRKRKISLTIAT